MINSVAVFDPGFRLTDNSTGAVVPGGVIYFYDAGTTNPKSVYADKNLSVTLGVSVTVDGLGAPTSDGSTKTIIYVDTSPYKIVATDSSGTTLWSYDNQNGAVVTTNPSDIAVVAKTPVFVKSLDYTIVSGDQSAEFVANCSSADVTLTLPSAVAVTNGWFVHVEHAGSQNQVLIVSTGGQTISSGDISYGSQMVLARSGEGARFTSDGGNWRVSNHTPPHIKGGYPIIAVEDRLTAPPGSEVNGAYYLIAGTPTGAWSSYSDGNIVQFTLGSWVRFTPLEGFEVWVKDEDKKYRHNGTTWVIEDATTAATGTVRIADKAAVVARTANRVVTPDQMRFEPAACKAWVCFIGSGTASILDDDGFSSLTDYGVGTWSVTMDTAMANANYAAVFGGHGQSNAVACGSGNINTTTIIYVNGFIYNSGTNNDIRAAVAVHGQQ